MHNKIKQAINALNTKKHEKGIELLKDVLRDDPKNDTALYNLALAYNSINCPEKAIDVFNEYLRHYPKDSNIMTGLGYSLFLTRKLEKAREILEEAISLDPCNIYALRNLGGILAELKDFEKAKTIFNDILKIEPDDNKALFGLGLIYFYDGDYSKSADYFYRILAMPLSDDEKQPAKDYLTKIAEKTLKEQGFRYDAVMYFISAINTFRRSNIDKIKKISFDIASLGQNGLDINDPSKTYNISSLDNKEMTGLCAVCHMYAGFKILNPDLDMGIDLSKEYEQAIKTIKAGKS